jgi:hypothetical protein
VSAAAKSDKSAGCKPYIVIKFMVFVAFLSVFKSFPKQEMIQKCQLT